MAGDLVGMSTNPAESSDDPVFGREAEYIAGQSGVLSIWQRADMLRMHGYDFL